MIVRFLLMGILAAGFAFAQGGRGGGGMGGGEDMGGGMGGRGEGGMSLPSMPRVTNRIDVLTTTLKLDKDQKKNVKNILDEAQKQANPVHEQVVKSRLAVGEAIQDGKNQDEVNKLVTAEAALESQMAGIELGAFAKIYKALDQDQRNQTRSLFQMMKGIFDNKNWNNVQ
jgi:hypothetical protein